MKLLGILMLMLSMMGCAGFVQTHADYRYTQKNYNGHTQIMSVYIDRNFGEADKVEISKALEQWNYAFNGHARFDIISSHFDMEEDVLRDAEDGGAFLILKVSGDSYIVQAADAQVAMYKHGATGNDLSWGFTPFVGSHSVYLVRDRMNNSADVYYITMHELGHALGAEHIDGGLMDKFYDRDKFQCVDWSAIRQVAGKYGWNVDSVNYCLFANVSAKQQPSSMEKYLG